MTVHSTGPTSQQWDRVKDCLQSELGEKAFANLFARVEFVGIEETTVHLTAPTTLLVSHIKMYYTKHLLRLWQAERQEIKQILITLRILVSTAEVELILSPTLKPVKESIISTNSPVGQRPRHVKIEEIKRTVAVHYKISKSDMTSSQRTRSIVRPRQIAIYLARKLTLHSLPEIGRRFGGRDHSTVLHAISKIEGLMAEDERLAKEIDSLKESLGK